LRNTILKSMKVCGVTAVAFGALVFSSGQASAAEENELGNKLLYQGKAHEHVVEMKELLAEQDLLDGEEFSNEYDKQTKEAVRSFQEEYGLIVDGLAGEQTLGALFSPEKGDEGLLVLNLQEDLADLGYYKAKLDGIFGPITENAVTDFQGDHGVEGDETGVAGPNTYGALHEAVRALRTSSASSNSSSSEQSGSSSNDQSGNSGSSQSESSEQSSGSSSEGQAQSQSTEKSEETSSASESQSSDNSNETSGNVMTMEATAYTAGCEGCTGITYTGQDLNNNPNKKVVAVDPNVIPLGSIVEVEGYGRAVAGDIGGAIKGNRIDLHMATKDEAIQFGRRDVKVTIVETP
jgi:3D (Asp-Asp-Asp) domain-containing protein